MKGNKMNTEKQFPMVIQFLDTKKIKAIFSYEQLKKHMGQPITIVKNNMI